MRRPGFFNPRDDLSPDRIVRILVARNQIEKVRRNGERELVPGKQNSAAFFVAKIDSAAAGLELSQRGNPVLELPLPIIPKFRCYAWPVTRHMRHELFSVTIPKRFHF